MTVPPADGVRQRAKTMSDCRRHGVLLYSPPPSEVPSIMFIPGRNYNLLLFQVATLQLPPDRKTKREQLAAQKEQHGKVSRTKSLKMKILGSNEELTVEDFNPNPLPATAPVVGEHNPLDAAVASASGASPPHLAAQVSC